jgi:hypothetical protein
MKTDRLKPVLLRTPGPEPGNIIRHTGLEHKFRLLTTLQNDSNAGYCRSPCTRVILGSGNRR